jgi:hypothetical protein
MGMYDMRGPTPFPTDTPYPTPVNKGAQEIIRIMDESKSNEELNLRLKEWISKELGKAAVLSSQASK